MFIENNQQKQIKQAKKKTLLTIRYLVIIATWVPKNTRLIYRWVAYIYTNKYDFFTTCKNMIK